MDTMQQHPVTAEQRPDKSIAIIAYLTLIGLIVAFVMNNDKKQPFAAYHIRQSLVKAHRRTPRRCLAN